MYSNNNYGNYYRPAGFGGFSLFPTVIKNIMIINAVIFLVKNIILERIITGDGVPVEYILTRYFALMPLGQGFQIWQLITYQFMHHDFMHILFNMFILWMFGMEIENVWGPRKFLLYYLTCGVGAGLMHVLLSPMLTGVMLPTVGASGAIYGVMIAFAMLFPDRYIFLYFLIPVKAKYLIVFFILLELFSVGSFDFVARLAHLGGALVGFVFIMLDRNSSISLKGAFNSFKRSPSNASAFKKRGPFRQPDIVDADFYEINKKEEDKVDQEEIDRILDKISRSGYQNLTEREKKILFEASKKS